MHSMTQKPNGIGQRLSDGLRLSSDASFERDKTAEVGRVKYRRDYWQGYAKRVKRIFGTVTRTEYVDAKQRADNAGRSVWGQIWAEASAYRQQATLSTSEIAEQQRELIAELRRIGNNINQLAKLGHVQARKHGGLVAQPSNSVGTEAMRQLEKLEEKVARFDDGITIHVRAEQTDDRLNQCSARPQRLGS